MQELSYVPECVCSQHLRRFFKSCLTNSPAVHPSLSGKPLSACIIDGRKGRLAGVGFNREDRGLTRAIDICPNVCSSRSALRITRFLFQFGVALHTPAKSWAANLGIQLKKN